MSLMDVARGAYARSPDFVRRALAPAMTLVPTHLKYGATYRRWRDKIAKASSDPTYADREHLAALRRVLQQAHDGSPFYRDLLDKHLGHSFDYAGAMPEDLRHLPVLRKGELRKAGDAQLTVPVGSLEKGYTAGSNGEPPFGFYLERGRSSREMAFVNYAWGRTGLTEDDAKIVLRGFGLEPNGRRITEWEPALRELRLSVFPMTRKDIALYLDLIDKYEVQYLYGYPSAIDLLCRHMCVMGRIPRLPIKGILPISEPMFEHQRKTIKATLGNVPISNFYGMSEKVLFATEDMEAPHHYRFNPLYGLAELVDDDGQTITEPGVEGRIIGTGLLTAAQPFIRYDTEDRAELVELPSAENGRQLVLSRIVPRRKPDYLVAANGNRIVTIDFTPENPKFYTGIEEYQFYQDTPGKAVIRYIPDANGTVEDAQRVADDLARRTLGEMQFTVEEAKQLATGRAGKRAFIDQRLDVSIY
ncbi:hypothetical protein [Devosia sp.]|uniref:hypothetical protein n=1 Tax=Devosia sp. TaxID=1871048 RepID=UPI003A8D4AED